jgi:hypothetical protein
MYCVIVARMEADLLYSADASIALQIGDKPRFGNQQSEKTAIYKDFGRGGGDRNDEYLNKARALNALQPPTPANWNKRNKMTDLLVPNHRCKTI